MPGPVASTTPSSSSGRRRLRRPRFGLLAGLALILLGTPTLVVVALTTGADWPFIAALATFTAGLLTVGRIIAPGRSSFRAGTKIWQNDGLPGGGGGAA